MSDDPTKKLPNAQNDYITQPGVTAILERINALDEKWEKRITRFESKVDSLTHQVKQISNQLDVITLDIAKVRGDLREHTVRIEEIEDALQNEKAS